jgi:ketosteroid isomerase-like protein
VLTTGSDCFASPEECETAFYDAFRQGDLAAMQRIWGSHAEVVCIHPARPPLAGRRAVMQSWEDILATTGGVEVRFDCQSRVRADSLAVHMGIEIIGTRDSAPAMVTVTNIYGLTEHGWTMRAHHAAPIHRGAGPRGPVH